MNKIELDPGDYMGTDGFIRGPGGLHYRDKVLNICHHCQEKAVVEHMGCGLWLCRKKECRDTREDAIQEILEYQRKLRGKSAPR